MRFHCSPSALNRTGPHGSGEASTRRCQWQTLPSHTGKLPKSAPGDSACITVGTAACSWVDAEVRRTNEGTEIEPPGYVGAQINNPRNAKDSQGTERPLRGLLLLFPQGKRRPRRRRGGKGKIEKRAPAAPQGRQKDQSPMEIVLLSIPARARSIRPSTSNAFSYSKTSSR